MGPTIRKRLEFFKKSRQHAVNVLANVGVCEPDGRVPAKLVHSIAGTITISVVSVPIHFHDQRLLRAEEVDDAIPDDVLPAELEATKLRTVQPRPQRGFERAHPLTQTLCSTDQMRRLAQRRSPPLPLP